MDGNRLLDRLTDLLDESGREAIYPCIGDLVVNGLQVSRFTPPDRIPNRQDVTQYIAQWCREARLTEDACRTWLCDYALSTLSSLSRSSPSAIRHSTKCNVKFIYRSASPFVCERVGNRFRAACSPTCRVYSEMKDKAAAITTDSLTAKVHRNPAAPPTTPAPSKKELYREQFLSAMRLVSRELSNGTKKIRIVDLLKQKGLKTRTGREWTYAILTAEIRKDHEAGRQGRGPQDPQ